MSKINFITTVEARSNSTRLPGKVLLSINKKKTILEFLIERIKKSKYTKNIIVATTTNKKDDRIVKILKRKKIKYFRGSEENVLERLYFATKNTKAKAIIQLTGDNPLIDPEIINHVVNFFIKNYPKYDFVSNNNLFQKKKNNFPLGMIISVFKKKSLKTCFEKASKNYYFEHPALYFYTGGKKFFKIKNLGIVNNEWKSNLNPRLTIDTREDYSLLRIIYNNFKNNNFGLKEILNFLKCNKSLLKINSKIKQKIPKIFVN
jgi:spore coat polysaccharide biosynthesis protein SpsF